MKKILILILVLCLAVSVVYGKDYEVKKRAGQYEVEASIDKNPPVVGMNNITIKIKDSIGKVVTSPKVRIDYSMPAMPGMPAMNYKTDTVLSGEEYNAKLNLSMSGSWNITVKIVEGNKTSSMKFNIDAQ